MLRFSDDYRIKLKMFCLKALHFILTVAIFYVVWLYFRYDGFPRVKDVGYRYNYFVAAGFALQFAFFNRTYNSYLFGYSRIRTLAMAQFLSQLFSVGIIYFLVSIGWNHFESPVLFCLMLIGFVFLNFGFAYVGNAEYIRLNPVRKTLLIYRNKQDRKRFGSIKGKPMERLYKIEKELQYDGSFDELRDQLEGFDAIFVAGVNSHCRNGILKYCEENNIRGFFLPHIGDVIMQGAEHLQSFDSPVMMVRRKQVSPDYRVSKRIFDAFFAMLGLFL